MRGLSLRLVPWLCLALASAELAAPAAASRHSGEADEGPAWAGRIHVEDPASGCRLVFGVRLTAAGRGRLRTTALEVLESRPPHSPAPDGEPAPCPFDPIRYYHCAFQRCLSGAARCLQAGARASDCFGQRCRHAFAACFDEAFHCRPELE